MCGSLWAGGCWGFSGCQGKSLVLLMIPSDRIPLIISHWCRDSHILSFEPLGPWQKQHSSENWALNFSSQALLGRKKPQWRRGGGFLCWLKARRQPGLDPGKTLVIDKRVWGPCEELPLFICDSFKSLSSFSNRLRERLHPPFKSYSFPSLCTS